MASWVQMIYNETRMSSFSVRLIFWIFVSLALHLAYVWSLSLVPASWLQAQQNPEPAQPISIDLVTAEKTAASSPPKLETKQQFVRQAQPEDSFLTNNKEKARFKSERDQRVLLETRAKEIGLTKNRSPEPRFLKEVREAQLKKNPPLKLSQNGLDYSEFKPLDLKKEFHDLGDSSIGESLPQDVSIGSFTALNTDRFTFYTFYARIEELIRFRWETRVKEAVESFSQAYLAQTVFKKNWITQIEFLLTPKGEIHQVRMIQNSGIAKFDQAPVWAFRDARTFPNPPQEMVESDGFIHLHYTFNVQLNSSVLVER